MMLRSRAEHDVLAALVVVHHRDGRATVRTVATEAHRVPSTVHVALARLRWRGLVRWNGPGSLRPSPDLVVIGGEVHRGQRVP